MSTEKDLDHEVRRLLNESKGQWVSITKKADISYSWLSKFVNGHIENPGYATLKRLHAALTDGGGATDPGEQVPAIVTHQAA